MLVVCRGCRLPQEISRLGSCLRVIGDELVDRGGKADHFRRNVVDQRSAVNAATVQILQESLGRAAIFDDLFEIGALALHQFKRMRLEQFDRLDMDVAVGDHEQWSAVVGGQFCWLLFPPIALGFANS